jgi:alcohol dehydrogenase (cytochrome c)
MLGTALRAMSLLLFAVAGAGAQDAAATTANWPHYGGTQFAWRYSALNQINAANVKALTPAWIFQTGDYAEGLLSTPLVIDGMMYVITPRAWVYALDAATGRLVWEYHYARSRAYLPGSFTDFTQNRGVAVSDGKIFFGTSDSVLVALDQKSGHEVWRVNVDDAKQCGCNITAAPLVVKDKVVVGGTGGDSAHRGYLTAFNARTGRLAWRWYVIPGLGEKGNETWKGDSWKYGGGSPWMTGSFDPELNLIYWGTGNAASDLNAGYRVNAGADKRKDVNLYTASVVALDADTGVLRWHYQEVPADVWDFDSSYEAVLMDRQIHGQNRKLLVHMNKSGVTFILDRVTGEVLNAFDVVEVRNWITGVTEDGRLLGRREPEMGKTTNICPSVAGAKSWNSMAYSPRTGFLYAPVNEICNDLTPADREPQEGKFFSSGTWRFNRQSTRATFSHVDALDAVTGKRAWSFPYKYILLASMLTTAGDLVFTGTPEGEFFALDARSGEKLWTYQTGAGHRGSAVSYAANGRQFVATPTGFQKALAGGMAAILFPDASFRTGSTIVAFALPEGAK